MRSCFHTLAALLVVACAVDPTLEEPTEPVESSVARVAVADTYVDSAAASQNYGTAASLRTDGSPSTMRTYLKFDLASLEGQTVTRATLRIRTAGNPSSATHEVRLVTGTLWSETAMTYSSAPAVSSTVLGSLAPTATGTWYDVPLATSPVQARLGGKISMALVDGGADGAEFSSRETAYEPQLVVETGSRRVLWGARIDGNGYEPDMTCGKASYTSSCAAPFMPQPWDVFENASHMDKTISYLQWGVPFGKPGWADVDYVHGRGAVPALESMLRKGDGTQWTLTQVANGAADAVLTTFASTAAARGYPFIYRLWHEMNGPWYRGEGIYGNPTEFVRAWKHVYKLVKPIAPNVIFMWCPNAWIPGVTNAVDPAPYFPGNEFVDAVGQDFYRRYPAESQIDPGYNYLRSVAPGKLMYFEFGWDYNWTTPVTQAQYHEYVLDLIETKYADVDAINFFHRQDDVANDALRQSTFDAVRSLIANPLYLDQAPPDWPTLNR